MRSLVESALLDQERRILATDPRDFANGGGSRRGRAIKQKLCKGGCGRMLHGNCAYDTCKRCKAGA